MADLSNNHNSTPTLLLTLFLLTLPSFISAADYTRPTGYFINCGSADTVGFTSRQFVGDSKASSLSFTKQSSSQAVSSNSSSTGLYSTARIFRAANSSYSFKIQSGSSPYFLRLHFSPFISADAGGSNLNLSDALFDVSVPGLTLLRNFTVPLGNSSAGGAATVREFLLTIKGGEFFVYFTPIAPSSFSFVNAVEVFPVPEDLVPGLSPRVGTRGQNGNSTIDGREVLATSYRLNVGGSPVETDSDTLWRQWAADDDFLKNPNSSQQANAATQQINYQDGITRADYLTTVDNYTAPVLVYQTAREMNTSGGIYRNVTWQLGVGRNSTFAVRFHFCDIVGIAENTVWFSLFVFDNFAARIDPYGNGDQSSIAQWTPFKMDLVIDSGGDGLIKVGIANDSNSPNAYLNGLEVMEMIGVWDWNSTGSNSNQNKHIGLIVGVAIGGSLGFLLVLVLVGILALKCRRRGKPTESTVTVWSPLPGFVAFGSSHGNKTSEPSVSSGSPLPNLHLGLKIPLSEILSATSNFDGKLMIGHGGFGNVYRGTLKNGMVVAVKRSEPGSSQGLLEFQTEIIVLSKIRHRHLVSLIGYCAERSEMILVYEFVEKGTLRHHLYNTELPPLTWRQRLEICIGAARGLHYLHTGAAGGIIHRDVKSTNILLDSNYIAKVADFGLSKLGSALMDQSEPSMGFKGTFGYLDPEYMKTQQLTEKSDVYAFGVVLLEVLCARAPIDPALPRDQMNLAEWGVSTFKKGELANIVDPSLSGQVNSNSLRKFGETAEKCLREDDTERPTMGDVLWDLEYALQLQVGRAGPRQFYEDSGTANGSSVLGFSTEVRRLPSFNIDMGDDESGAVVKENDEPEGSK